MKKKSKNEELKPLIPILKYVQGYRLVKQSTNKQSDSQVLFIMGAEKCQFELHPRTWLNLI